MKYPGVAIFLLAFTYQYAQARPMDCSKASTADAAMGEAYAAILKSPDDASLRHWIGARDQNLGELRDSADLGAMFGEIYALPKPVAFERLDVSAIVTRYFPLNTPKAVVTQAFAPSGPWAIVEDLPDRLVVRNDRGRALVDPDASSVVMTFVFSTGSTLSQVQAVRFKSQ
ncbi:DUF6393 family protein [Pseudomonas sp. nanlin1]|uniref:DUF6393 family protein n=1 Tax=Pseudomonas sp. nanlin1 TaxID=3040605 RepID=UPI00388D4099